MSDTKRWTINSGSRFEELAGYSRAVIEGNWIFVSGTAGFNFEDGSISDDAAEQARQALRTIEATLEKAGAAMSPVSEISQVLTKGAVPPSTPTVTLYAIPIALERIRVGNISAM